MRVSQVLSSSFVVLFSLAVACRESATPAVPAADATPILPASTATPAMPSATPEPTPTAIGPPTGGLWRPVAPDAAHFEWRGKQKRLVGVQSGTTCEDARVVVGQYAHALCYVDTSDRLLCAGLVQGGIPLGPTFVAAGQTGVDQILGSPIVGGQGECATTGCSALCVKKRDGTAWCTGGANQQGQFNLPGGGNPGHTWKQWGARSDIVELAGGFPDNLCARYADGTAECAGHFNGMPHVTPALVGGPSPAVETLYQGFSDGTIFINDPDVFRSSATCVVTAAGLSCIGGVQGLGTPGRVVDGAKAGRWGMTTAIDNSICWLEDDGAVWCREPADPVVLAPMDNVTTRRYFGAVPGRAVALAVDLYSWTDSPVAPPARCAAFDDGSLWCIGENASGKLGTGGYAALTVETAVAPPGSVRIDCAGAPDDGDDDDDDDGDDEDGDDDDGDDDN